MKKKTLSTILTIALVITMFSSCRNKNDITSTNNTVSNTTSVSSEQDTTTSIPNESKSDITTSELFDSTSSNSDNEVSKVQTESQIEPVVSEPAYSQPSEPPVVSTPEEPIVSQPEENPIDIPALSVKLDKSTVSLFVGESTNLIATIRPTDVTDKVIIWTSDNTSIATVSNGKITAKAVGTATITATTSNGKTATCTVTVKKAEPIEPTSVKLSQNSLSMTVGNTKTLTATILPTNAENKAIKWTSSNTSIATISNGKITAKSVGTATITATTSNGKTATCKITVKEVDPYAKPFNAELIKQDMIRYIQSLGVNYVEMGLEDGSWTAPVSTQWYALLSGYEEWDDEKSNRFRYECYSIIDSDLKHLTQDSEDYGITIEEMYPYLYMCPYIYEDTEYPGNIYVTVIYH